MGINRAATKGFIKDSGMNASADSVNILQEKIDNFAKEMVAKAKEAAESENRKTIQGKHLENISWNIEEP